MNTVNSGAPIAIDVRGLRKTYGASEVVRGLTFSVRSGEVVGVLGPNGAGKSTTMKMIVGFLPPSAGEIFINSVDVQRDPVRCREQIGYLPEGSPLYGEMTVASLLSFVASIRGLGRKARERIPQVVEELALQSVLHQRVETLSKGFKRRVGLAQSILHDPPILILDEPTDGLDPNQKAQARALIGRMRKSKAIIVSTHLLEEVDEVCDRVIVINKGEIVFSGSPAELHARAPDHNVVRVRVPAQDAARAQAELRRVVPDGRIEERDCGDTSREISVSSTDQRSLAVTVGSALQTADVPIIALHVESGKLGDAFAELTRPVTAMAV